MFDLGRTSSLCSTRGILLSLVAMQVGSSVGSFHGEVVHYRKAAAGQRTVDTPPWPVSTGRGHMLLSSSRSAALSNSKQHPLHVTTPITNKHLLVSQTRAGTGRLAGLAWPATGGRPMSRTFPQANAGRLKRWLIS